MVASSSVAIVRAAPVITAWVQLVDRSLDRRLWRHAMKSEVRTRRLIRIVKAVGRTSSGEDERGRAMSVADDQVVEQDQEPVQGLTASEIAMSISTTSQAINNWARRFPDFPAPISSRSGRPVYSVALVAAWLDSRRLPVKMRGELPAADQTYGERFRRAFALPPAQVEGPAPTARRPIGTQSSDKQDPWKRLFSSFQEDSSKDYQHDVTTFLAWLWVEYPSRWREVVQAASPFGASKELPGRATSLLLQNVDHRDWPAEEVLQWAVPESPNNPAPSWSAAKRRKYLIDLANALDVTLADHQPDTGEATSASGRVLLFDILLDRLAQGRQADRNRGRQGAPAWYFTPTGLAETVTEILAPGAGERVLDPCCGSGEFLAAAARHVARSTNTPIELYGVALDSRSQRSTLTKLAVQDLALEPKGNIRRMDVGGAPHERAKVVVSNPPFHTDRITVADLEGLGEWTYGTPAEHGIEFAWVQVVLRALDEGGRGALVMPFGATDPHHDQGRKAWKTC